MKIVEQSVELMGDLDGEEILWRIEAAARNSYKSEGKNEERDTKKRDALIRHAVKRGHSSVLEHGNISFRVLFRHGDTVVILGAGPVGLIMHQLARAAGASRTVVVEPQEHKRALAGAEGATLVVDPVQEDVLGMVRGLEPEGADVVNECAGTPATTELSLKLARRGGTAFELRFSEIPPKRSS